MGILRLLVVSRGGRRGVGREARVDVRRPMCKIGGRDGGVLGPMWDGGAKCSIDDAWPRLIDTDTPLR